MHGGGVQDTLAERGNINITVLVIYRKRIILSSAILPPLVILPTILMP